MYLITINHKPNFQCCICIVHNHRIRRKVVFLHCNTNFRYYYCLWNNRNIVLLHYICLQRLLNRKLNFLHRIWNRNILLLHHIHIRIRIMRFLNRNIDLLHRRRRPNFCTQNLIPPYRL